MGLVKHVKGSFHPLLPLPLPTFLTLIPQTEPKNYLHSFFVWPKFRVNNGFDFVEEKKSIKICIIDTIFALTISPNLPTQQIKFQKKKNNSQVTKEMKQRSAFFLTYSKIVIL